MVMTSSSNNAIRQAEAIPDPSVAVIDISTSGDNTIITGTATKKIRIYSLVFVSEGTVSITLKDGATAISGAMAFSANMGFSENFWPAPITLSSGNAFVINLSAAVAVRGFVIYTQV